jgi:DHA2 family methylenomycin A resistance protein-like MFS transporter
VRAGSTRPGLVLLTVAVGQFLAVGSASIVSVALPTIARDLGATGEQQQWIVDAYVANAAGLIVFFALIGATVYFSAYFQQVQGRGPVEAGLCVLPLGAGVALGAPVAGRLTGRLGARTPMGLGLGLACVAMLGLLRLEPGTQVWAIWWDFLVLGLGAGLALPPMTATAVGAVRPARAGMASAVHNALRQVGQALGVAVLGALVFAQLGGAAASGARLDPAGGEAFVRGLHHATVVSAALLAVGLVLALVLVPKAGGQAP